MRMNNCRFLLIGLFLLIGISVYAEEKVPRKYWKAEFLGTLTNYSAWEVEPSVTYQPFRYVGVTLGLVFSRPINEEGFGGKSQDKQWNWSAGSENDGSHFFSIRPSLQFSTPSVVFGKDKDCEVYFTFMPGLTLPLPANAVFDVEYYPNQPGVWSADKVVRVQNEGASSVFYQFRGALSLELEGGAIFSIGYSFSNYDLYSGTRNITIEGRKLNPKKQSFMHSFFLGLGFRF